MEKEFLGLIPARGGSKSIPLKNIKPLLGKPLIAYTIEEALKSKYLDRIIVSTDDAQIAKISNEYGADVPFIRPKELAQDTSPTLPVIQHALMYLKSEGYIPDFVVLLQPTSPLRQVKHIDEAIEKILDTNADSVISLTKSEIHPYWMCKLDGDKVYPFIDTGKKSLRRQDLPIIYKLNGAIVVSKTEVILSGKSWQKQDIRAIIMDPIYSIDIDTPLDFYIAEKIMELKERNSLNLMT
jgi:N-acylneuraminate cytidylyltransferase/CMP-N,N'-diacetyllegionaminic acid synthase